MSKESYRRRTGPPHTGLTSTPTWIKFQDADLRPLETEGVLSFVENPYMGTSPW